MPVPKTGALPLGDALIFKLKAQFYVLRDVWHWASTYSLICCRKLQLADALLLERRPNIVT